MKNLKIKLESIHRISSKPHNMTQIDLTETATRKNKN